ncbi:peptidyl-prolyl cis-trans isomerase, partial [Acrasis kona]
MSGLQDENDRKARIAYLLSDEDLVNPYKKYGGAGIKKTEKMLSAKELKKLKYKKTHKKNFMAINELHLKNYDPFQDLSKLRKEQEQVPDHLKAFTDAKNKKKKTFNSPIPQERIDSLYPQITDKGYVTLDTNYGNLNIELYCNKVPKTCDNFLMLCERGSYNNTQFHRLIKGFMVQGGQTKNGLSAFGAPFEDEIVEGLTHSSRGILSMANNGVNTNQCQFFISFVPCPHLDGKYSIFGKVVGGLDVLDEIEKIKTIGTDQPTNDLVINKVIVYHNPFLEALDEDSESEEDEEVDE